MNRRVSIVLPNIQRRLPFAHAVQHLLNATAKINADWVLEEWAAGREPKCCAKCNGTRYRPDDPHEDIVFETSPVLFARGYASCGEIAACHTGHKIAEAVMGRLDRAKFPHIVSPMAWNEAAERFFVMFDRNPGAGPGSFHAICNDDGTILDPTIGMVRMP